MSLFHLSLHHPLHKQRCPDRSGANAQKELKMPPGEKKRKLQSPLLLSLIKFSALITIKPLSMYNNVCITEQHRCSPSTQLNIKVAVAVLIPARCVCVCVCPDAAGVARRPAAPSLAPPVMPLHT